MQSFLVNRRSDIFYSGVPQHDCREREKDHMWETQPDRPEDVQNERKCIARVQEKNDQGKKDGAENYHPGRIKFPPRKNLYRVPHGANQVAEQEDDARDIRGPPSFPTRG